MKKEYTICLAIILAITAYLGFKYYLITKRRACMSKAFVARQEHWKSNCEGRGESEDCSLPAYLYNWIYDNYNKEKDDCIQLYK